MYYFDKALPVWIKNKETSVNLRVQFKTVVKKADKSVIRIATSGMYVLNINNKFVCYGPSRAGKNHFRTDEIQIGNNLNLYENIIIIEVAGYNVNSFAIQNQTSFLQAEIVNDENIVAFTGADFSARINPYYYRKTQRYSFQRPMMESYNISKTNDDFFTVSSIVGNESVVATERKNIIARYAPYPQYEKITAQYLGGGTVSFKSNTKPWRDKANWGIGDELIGFTIEELDVFATDDLTGIRYSKRKINNERLNEKTYSVYKLPYEASGFLTLDLNCNKNTQIFVLFDELETSDGTVNHLRLGCANVVRYDLCKGEHHLQMFEVYSMHYIQIVVMSGDCVIKKVGMTEYKHPPIRLPKLKSKRLQKIAMAAAETFRQNAVDIFMDCPSRERAGWLCDSFFTARAEHYATGKSQVEKSFLENFLHEENFDFLPDGMLPMCYPADFYDKTYIPQWAMWFVIQLKEYYDRSKDGELVNKFERKIKKLFSFFANHENKLGLLENLGGWNFVEHSKANSLVYGVNYPTNMMYYAALTAADCLYPDSGYFKKAQNVKKTVLDYSFNGEFFTDNSIWENDELKSTGEITEVCQYYAYFTNIADEQSHKELLDILITEFGPKRKRPEKWKNIYPAAPFIGYFLRLEILSKCSEFDRLSKNIEDYYYEMACTTGTLWEHADERASCNHGFSSYILCLLDALSSYS